MNAGPAPYSLEEFGVANVLAPALCEKSRLFPGGFGSRGAFAKARRHLYDRAA
jgi:hypothetical protein